MTWTDFAAIAALVSAIAGGIVALYARGAANKLNDAQSVKVIVEAAGNAADILNDALIASSKTVKDMEARLAVIESKLRAAESQNTSLQLQLGKVRKRVKVLEDFIRDLGHEPPAEEAHQEGETP